MPRRLNSCRCKHGDHVRREYKAQRALFQNLAHDFNLACWIWALALAALGFCPIYARACAVLYSSPKAAAVVSGMIFFVKNQSAFEGVRFLRLGRRDSGGHHVQEYQNAFQFRSASDR